MILPLMTTWKPLWYKRRIFHTGQSPPIFFNFIWFHESCNELCLCRILEIVWRVGSLGALLIMASVQWSFGQFLTFQRDEVATQERKLKGNFSGRKMATIHQKLLDYSHEEHSTKVFAWNLLKWILWMFLMSGCWVDSVGSGYNRDFSKLLVWERIEQVLRFLNCKFLKVAVEWILLEVATIVISERSQCKKELNESLGFWTANSWK